MPTRIARGTGGLVSMIEEVSTNRAGARGDKRSATNAETRTSHGRPRALYTGKNGKTRTITKSFTKPVDEDFTWKDPNAA
jgi:hypothetical protein